MTLKSGGGGLEPGAAIDDGLAAGLLRSDPRIAAASRCLQCGTCTPFCTGALETNFAFLPRKVTAAIAGNRPLEVEIDQCVQCMRCGVLCPRGITVGSMVNALYEVRQGLRPFREIIRIAGMIPAAGFLPLYTRGLDPFAFAQKKLGYKRVVTSGATAELRELLRPEPDGRAIVLSEGERRPRPPSPVPDEVYGFQSCCAFNYPGIASSTDLLLDRLGIGVRRSNDETCCCGAPHYLGEIGLTEHVLIGARNLTVVAETMGTDDVATGVGICPTCYSTYREALDLLADPRNRTAVNARLARVGRRFESPADYAVLHILEVLDARRDALRAEAAGSLAGLRVGIHLSCHFRAATRDDHGYQALRRLVAMTGAQHVPSVYDTYCCGGVKDLFGRYLAGRRDEPSLLNREAADARHRDEIDFVVVDCPGCMLVYDHQGVPVVHIAELMALAAGRSPRQAGLSHHFTPVAPVLEERDAL